MDLDFTPEQELLRDSVRRTCVRHHGMDVVRKLENDPVGYSPALWTQLADLGVLGVTIGEEHGGSGMTMLDAAIIYEELGRALVASPHLVSCVLAAGMISRSHDSKLKQTWLPAIAAGEAIVTVAWLEPGGSFADTGVQLTAREDGGQIVLAGVKQHVPFAQAAGAMLVLARADAGVVAVLVEAGADGLTLTQQQTIAGDTQYLVNFDNVRVDPAAVVHAAGTSWLCWHDTMLDAATLLAAQAVGGARAALELTIEYAKTRHQFDKPLAAFQSLSHYLADAVTRVDGAETLVWEAAWTRTEDESVAQLAPMAKSFACQTFRDVTAMAQQIFGGNGFTVEFDIQLYFRRAKSLQLNYWDSRYLDQLIAAELLDA